MKILRVVTIYSHNGWTEIPGRPVFARYNLSATVEVHYEAGRSSEVTLVYPHGTVDDSAKYLCTVQGDPYILAPTRVQVDGTPISSVARVDPALYHVYWRQK